MRTRVDLAVATALGICLLAVTGCTSGSTGPHAASGTGSAGVSPTPTPTPSPTPTEAEFTGTELAAALPPLGAYGPRMVESQNYPQNSGDALAPTDNTPVSAQTCWQLVNSNIGSVSDSFAFDGVQQANSDGVGVKLTVTFSLTQFAAGSGAQIFSDFTSNLDTCTTLSEGVESGTITTTPLTGLGDHAQRTDTVVTDTISLPGGGTQKTDPQYTRIIDVIYGDLEIEATARSYTQSSADGYNLTGLVQQAATKLSLK